MGLPVELNATQGSLLGFLHDGPQTGWDLLQAVSATLSRFWSVTPSHVYRELGNLERRKLVRARPRGPRDKKPYAITKAGEKAFAGWIAQEPGPEQIRFPLLVTLWFGRHLDAATLAGFVARQRADHQHRLAMYTDISEQWPGDDPHTAAVLEFGVRYEQAILDWLAALPFELGVERACDRRGRRRQDPAGKLQTMVERVAVLAPMVSELKPVVRAFGLKAAATDGEPKRHTGRAGTVEVVATMTGIGTRTAAETTERVLAAEPVDFVMVVGIAGGVGGAIKVGDVLVPHVVIDGPSGAEFRPVELTGIASRGRLVTSDDFHVDPDELVELEAAGVIALDMETAAVAAVCEKHGCAWSVVRSISDMANDHPIGDDVMNLARPDGTANVPGLLKYVSTHPGKLPQLMQLGRDSALAAKNAAEAALRACAALGAA